MIENRTKDQIWRLCSIGLFCGFPVLLLGLAASNTIDAIEAIGQAAQKRATTSSIVAQLEKHRSRTAQPVDTGSLYLKSSSETLARAEIQQHASAMVERAGGRLAEVRLTATPEQESDGVVAIQLSLEIDNKGLLDLLYAIESGLPFLEVIDLNTQKIGSGSEAAAAAAETNALRVEMTVQAHWKKNTG